MQGILQRALGVAAGVVVTRLILEQAGAPSWLTNALGVTWLYALVPIYLAMKIVRSGETRPYVTLARMSVGFVLAAAAMVGATYSLAYPLRFSAHRFSVAGGGVVGEGVAPLQGFVVIPLISFGLSAAIGLAAGFVIGPAVLWIAKRQ